MQASVRFMGHTSADPTVDLPRGVRRVQVRCGRDDACERRGAALRTPAHGTRFMWLAAGSKYCPCGGKPMSLWPVPAPQKGFLHVKGKSGLKHTVELLECWGKRPDLPLLHVVGRLSWNDVKNVAGARNIHFYPKVGEARVA